MTYVCHNNMIIHKLQNIVRASWRSVVFHSQVVMCCSQSICVLLQSFQCSSPICCPTLGLHEHLQPNRPFLQGFQCSSPRLPNPERLRPAPSLFRMQYLSFLVSFDAVAVILIDKVSAARALVLSSLAAVGAGAPLLCHAWTCLTIAEGIECTGESIALLIIIRELGTSG